MAAEAIARQHYLDRGRLSDAVAELARRSWSRLNPANLDSSWQNAAPELLVGLAGAQLAAARAADDYTADVLEEDAPTAVNPSAFAGRASDGRPLDTLLLNPITVVKAAVAGGVSVAEAMAAGYANLDMLVRTQLADAGRAADQVALVAHPAAQGYTRVLVGKSCSRCIVLAGRWYAWNAGFRRHPRCNCSHQPGRGPADGFQADPRRAFNEMTRAEQDKTFTINGAQAIRDGADIGRVVNARRGMATAGETRTRVRPDGLVVNERIRRQSTTRVGGRDVFTTTEAAGRRLRLMPEEIYRIAGNDRDEAVRLLRRNGYLSDARSAAQKVPPPRPKINAPVTPPARATIPKPATATPPPPPPVSAATSLRRGIDSGVRESKPLSGGAVGEVHLVTFNDGSQAIRKTAGKALFGYSPARLTDNEVLASKVGAALRAPVPAVVRTGDTEVFMEYVPDARPGMWLFRGLGPGEQPAKVAEFVRDSGDAGRRLGLLDLLIANDDRHNENWLVRPDGGIVGIDHGLVWPVSRVTQGQIEREIPHFSSPFARLFVPRQLPDAPNQGYVVNDLTPADIDWVQQRLEALRPDFAALDHTALLDYSLARLRQLRPWARGTTNRIRP